MSPLRAPVLGAHSIRMDGGQGTDSLAAGAGGSAWDFAVMAYGRPGAREAALGLQDRRGADIVAMLVLLHRAALGGGAPSADRLANALALVQAWRAQSVLPLRRIRRALKGWRFDATGPDPAAEAARAKVAEAERAAERVELDRLAAALAQADAPLADPAAAGAAALAVYCKVAGIACDARDRKDFAALLEAAIPASAGQAARLVDRALDG